VSVIERTHLVGIVGAQFIGMSWLQRPPAPAPAIAPQVLSSARSASLSLALAVRV
jgi:hypothetical protein